MNSALLFSLLVFLVMLIPLNAYGEVWKVQIPSGSAEPEASAHFLPPEISIRPGDKVEWGNTDTVDHTITSGTLETGLDEKFDSGFMGPGSRFTVMFSEEDLGETKYFCKLHPWMTGIINVVDLEDGFQVFHNVGHDVSETPVDIAYNVQRNLVDIQVDVAENSITFDFVGKINDDLFVVKLPDALIKDPHTILVNDKQTSNYELTTTDGGNTLSIILGHAVQHVTIIGTDVVGTPDPIQHLLVNQMYGITDKKFYEQGDVITISGKIQNPVQLYEIFLDIISPTGDPVYHKVIPLIDSAKFSETVSASGVLREFGEYDLRITAPSAKGVFLSFEYGIIPAEFKPPLKQTKSGISPGDVLCNDELVLLMKISTSNAICVYDSTADILLKRGYADYF